MGLTIYYSWKVKADASAARALVKKLHARVSKLPFDQVTEVREYDPPDGKYLFARADDDEISRRFKPGSLFLTRKRADGKTESVQVPALHVVFFMANLKGSETAMFGLATHPPVVLHREEVIRFEDGHESHQLNAGDPIEFPTRLRGWYSWSSFCKTQYAGNPKFGGPENFLRAHLSVYRSVEAAKKLGLKTRISDDAGFHRHRDQARLLDELRKYDELIAGFTGRFTDALGDAAGTIVAPIKDRPDFEHLEARGANRLRPLKPRRKKKK